MAQAAEKIIEFPAGGIANFYMEDDEIAALEREEAKEQFGSKGIANFSDVATRMASYGRYGDDTLAHVETGELIIPKDLINDNPKLRDSIFEHLEELGVEDPERYVVGSGANSINPDTGLPEFFKFLKKIARGVKKTVKKVTKAVKKVAKKVVKVVKKVAPIVLPIALSFTPLGAIYGAALGSGIGTLIQGGSLKDAFKSALVAGATGAVFKGLGNKLSGQGTFMEGVKKAAANPMGRLSQTASGLGSTLRGGGFTGEGNLFSDFVPTPSAVDSASVPSASEQLAADTAAGQPDSVREAFAQSGAGPKPAALTPDAGVQDFSTPMDLTTEVPTNVRTGGDSSFIDTAKGYYDKGVDFLTGGTPSQSAIDAEAARLMAENPSVYGGVGGGKLAQEAATKALTPGFVRAYGPSLALAGTAAYAGGFFDAPEDPPQEEMPTGADLIALDPSKYRLPEETPQYAQGPTQVGTNYGIDPRTGRPYVNPFRRPSYGLPVLAAEGGEIFPRRVGGIMPDEGTPGKDSVRAMLMPGEFVMTTNAVKGLGDGDNNKGINRMYDMMRGLEAKGRAMA